MRNDIYSDEHKRLRHILKRKRVAAGLRQQDVAAKTKRSQEYISKFERGLLRLDVIDFMKICEAIGCSAVTVMEELDPQTRRAETYSVPGYDYDYPSKTGEHTNLNEEPDGEHTGYERKRVDKKSDY